MSDESPEPKLCVNCIYSRLTFRTAYRGYECEEPRNLSGVSLVDGQNTYVQPIEAVRSAPGLCWVTGNWWVEKMKVYFASDLPVQEGESSQDRQQRLLQRAVGLRSKSTSLRSTTEDDI